MSYRPFNPSPYPELVEQPAQFADGAKIKIMYEAQCQKTFKALAEGTLAVVVSSEWKMGSREYKIKMVADGSEYFGVPEDAITDKLKGGELKDFK